MDSRVTLTVETNFMDGSLREAMEAEGYPIFWKAGEKRTISKELARRVKASGATFVVPEEDAPESRILEEFPPVEFSGNELEQQYRERYAKEEWVKVMFIGIAGAGLDAAVVSETNFTDGNLSAEFSAIDRPPSIGVNEIVELPRSLLRKCESSGAAFTTNAEEMAAFEGSFQARHEHPLEAWRKERNERVQAETQRRNAERLQAETERILQEEADKKIQSARHKALKELGVS